MRAAVIVNPNAGVLRRNPGLAERLRQLCDHGSTLFVTRDDAHLAETAQILARERVLHVGIVGGDGTASTTLTALWRAYGDGPLPCIAFLRGGTMNTIANGLGVSRRPPRWLLRRAGRAWNTEAPGAVARKTLRIGDRLGFLFGTGLMYGYLSEYYAAGEGHPTPVTAASVLAHATASAVVGGKTFERIRQPRTIGVRFDGGTWPAAEYLTVGAGTVPQAGLGFRPFYRAFEDDLRFHLLAIMGSPRSVVRDLPRVWLGRGFQADAARQTTTSWAELQCPQGSFGYFVDGDLLEAQGSLALGVGPQFRVLRI